jgi:hypothetical protein
MINLQNLNLNSGISMTEENHVFLNTLPRDGQNSKISTYNLFGEGGKYYYNANKCHKKPFQCVRGSK